MDAARKYHHGNLKEAFLKAARDLLERDGLGGLSLRKCAEKVGVSHAAPKNHFGNIAGLLTAMVTTGYAELAVMMTADANTNADRKRRRDQALLGYVAFAQANPALYDLMFSRDRLVQDDPDLLQQVRACFVILADCSAELGWHHGSLERQNGKGPSCNVEPCAWLCAIGHGRAFQERQYERPINSGYPANNRTGWPKLKPPQNITNCPLHNLVS